MKASLPGPKQEPLSLCSLVNLKDRLSSTQVVDYLKTLVQTQAKVSDPLDDIEAIFTKIQKWKQKFGDLDQQEKAVSQALKNTKSKINIHNVKTLLAKLNELKADIGLSEEDIMIIIYTSLDHDYLTNLLVLAGEFLKWFNLNFEGESREEIDFKDNKCEIWLSTCTMAKDIIAEHAKMTSKQEDILTQYWWEHLRYKNFGTQIANKFKAKPNLLTEMRGMFRGQ
jgi:hypothetical protein